MKSDEMQVLRVENLCWSSSGFQLSDINISLEKGYFMGLVGKNGSGKSTLIRNLLGFHKKKSGKIYIDGIDTDKNPLVAKEKIGFIVDDQPFLMNLSIEENGKYFGAFYSRYTETVFQYWLKRLELGSTRKVGSLSKGEQIKLQLAFALAHNPSLLILDEPTGNLDSVFRREFIYILQDMIAREEVSVLLATHLTSDLDKVADYVALMEEGRITEFLSMEQVREEILEISPKGTLMDWMYQKVGEPSENIKRI